MIKIPTGNTIDDIKGRSKIISDFYRRWYSLHPDKKIYNIHLKEYISVKYVSITETMRHASKSYYSTLAVLQLDAILATSKKKGSLLPIKTGSKNQKDFSHMMKMQCNLEGIGTVKLMVGIKKKSKEKVQYCITAIST